ncbi:MAG: hypothetical protein JWO66_1403 [Candidatus Eremiobacteraeota bacterium]|nr:hypothetical protein [Candidatus Eremiobacteraeota bacterium]
MRVLAGALLAMLTSGPDLAVTGQVAVTLHAQPLARSCAVVSTATIVAYDARTPHEVVYRFVRSDGTTSRTQRIAFAGEGAVAQSVRDTWFPHGAKPWVALEIVAPQRFTSQQIAVAPVCVRRVAAATH